MNKKRFLDATPKFHKKILGEGAKLYKNFAKKFLAVGVSFSLATAMVPFSRGHFVAEAAVTRTAIDLTPNA